MATPESSDLDRLICDLEFENQEYFNAIKQEELKRKDYKKRIEGIKLKIEHEEEKTPRLDAETKRFHSQFTQNREHLQNYKKTLTLSSDHVEALKKKLPFVTEKMMRDREEHESILRHYNGIQDDYKAVYENFPLAKVLKTALQDRAHVEEMWRERNDKAEQLRSHIREFTNKSGDFTPYVDINSFVHKLAELQIETLTTKARMEEKETEKLSLKSELQQLQMEEKQEEERKREEEIKKKLEQQKAKEQEKREAERKRSEIQAKEQQMAAQKSNLACQDQNRVILVSTSQPGQQSISTMNLVKDNYKKMDVSRSFQPRIPATSHASTSSRLIFPQIPVTPISERQGSRYSQPRLHPSLLHSQFAAKSTSLIREAQDGETPKIVSWPSLKQPCKPSLFMHQTSQSSPMLTAKSRVTSADVCRPPIDSLSSPVKPLQVHPSSGGRLQAPSRCITVTKVPQKRFSLPAASQISPKRPIRGDVAQASAPAPCLPCTNTYPPVSHREYVAEIPRTPVHRESEKNQGSTEINTVRPRQASSEILKTPETPNDELCSTPDQQKTETGLPADSPYDLRAILSKVTAPKSPADCFVESGRAMFACDETDVEQQEGSTRRAEFKDNLFFQSVFGDGDAINCKPTGATATSYAESSLPTTEFNFGGTSSDAGQMNMETNIFGMFGSDADDKSPDTNSQANSFSFNFGGGDAAPSSSSTFSFF